MRFAFVLALVLGASVAACSGDVGSSDDAITDGRILVHFGNPGAAINKWGYDVKQDGRSAALKPALAAELFQQTGFNLLRVAVRAAEGHPSAGVGQIKDAAYADDLEAIAHAKAASPTVDVFASLKLVPNAPSFPGWVKSGGDVDAPRYAVLLENYLEYMHDHGVTIDWLGVDNERLWNEGNITAAKYNTIASSVKAWCKGHGLAVPGFIAAEDYGAKQDIAWLDALWGTNPRFDHVDHVGVHVYSKHRDEAGYVESLHALGDHDHGKGLWDSELHWNDLQEDGDVQFDDIQRGMLTLMDHFDSGFHAMTWWAFQPQSNGTKAGHVMSEVVRSTLGAQPLPTDDGDGKTLGGGKLNSRALKNGPSQVTLWVANQDGKHKDQWTEIESEKIASASYVQWSATGPAAGTTGNATIVPKHHACFSMTYPAHTITRVTVTLK